MGVLQAHLDQTARPQMRVAVAAILLAALAAAPAGAQQLSPALTPQQLADASPVPPQPPPPTQFSSDEVIAAGEFSCYVLLFRRGCFLCSETVLFANLLVSRELSCHVLLIFR